MAKGKSAYQFNISDPTTAEQIIQKWLTVNQFQPLSEGGITYYRAEDAMVGHENFEYQITGNVVTINAYLGTPQKPMLLSDGVYGAMQITIYKNKLNELFSAINSPMDSSSTSSSVPSNTSPGTSPTPLITAQPTSMPDFQQSIDKKNNTFAEISFWVSLVMLVTSFTGVIYGAIIILFNYWMAAQGLKSQKRGKAITAIVISSIAIIVFIIKLIIEINK